MFLTGKTLLAMDDDFRDIPPIKVLQIVAREVDPDYIAGKILNYPAFQ